MGSAKTLFPNEATLWAPSGHDSGGALVRVLLPWVPPRVLSFLMILTSGCRVWREGSPWEPGFSRAPKAASSQSNVENLGGSQGDSFRPPEGSPPVAWGPGCSARLLFRGPHGGLVGPASCTASGAASTPASSRLHLRKRLCIHVFLLGFSEAGRPAAFQPCHGGADHDHRVSGPAAAGDLPATPLPVAVTFSRRRLPGLSLLPAFPPLPSLPFSSLRGRARRQFSSVSQ